MAVTVELNPITREEMFMAKAAGQNVQVPEPITREEMFLAAIAKAFGSGGGSSGGADGRGIVSIVRTSGDGSAGTVDTYTITYTDETTSTFEVYNGADGDDYVLTEADKTEIAEEVKASLTTEEWTFTLEDGSEITKKVMTA